MKQQYKFETHLHPDCYPEVSRLYAEHNGFISKTDIEFLDHPGPSGKVTMMVRAKKGNGNEDFTHAVDFTKEQFHELATHCLRLALKPNRVIKAAPAHEPSHPKPKSNVIFLRPR